MTLLEKLRQLLGSDIDKELDDTDSTGNNQENKTEPTNNDKVETQEVKTEPSQTKTDTTDKKTEPVKDQVNTMEEGQEMIFEQGWYDPKTGRIDESKIKNPEVLGAIQQLTTAYVQEKNQRLISDKLNSELKNYSLNVSDETLKRVLNLSDVKISKDGEVTGVKEALEALKASDPALFKDKDKESNPLNEGFNPVEKRNVNNVNSFMEAFQLMDEISGN